MSIIRNSIEISKIIRGGVEFSKVVRNGIELWNAKENFILNGTFEDSSNITLEPEWTIVSEQAVYDGNGGAITFDLSSTLSQNTSYELAFEASNISTFVRFALNIEGASSVQVLPFTTYEVGSSGEIKLIFTVPTSNTDSNKLILRASSLAGAYTIDNISLNLANEATDVLNGTFDDSAYLSLGDAWSVSGGKLNFDDSGSNDVTFYLDGYIANGETYDFDFTVDSGTIRIENVAGNSVFLNYSSGNHTISFTNSSGSNIENLLVEFSNGAGATASVVDNVSITKTS